jgi:D-alanyl-D-alanine carboxypeptidase/D-alanyl-D-alanine-endopeptidase (penicillin-binding protein 4)
LTCHPPADIATRRVIQLLAVIAIAATAAAADPPLQAAARELVGSDQGVFAAAEDGTVLAAVEADRGVHPASVTKVATTLALLARLGPDHRFETRLLAAGPERDGALDGDLVVEAGGDPYLVSENAFLILLALRAGGLRAVEGRLRVDGPLLFNWRPDPHGEALGRVLAGREGGAAWAAVRATRASVAGSEARDVALRVAGRAMRAEPSARHLLLVHRSPPLVRVLKALNCYSNNVFHTLSERIGGPAAVERLAREQIAPPLRAALVIDDAAGAGSTNRVSPRAAVALLGALDAELTHHGRTLVDVLPVAGIDPGTLRDRLPGGAVVGKTGTYGSLGASALAGALRTRRHGRVLFAVLNRDLPVPEAQRRQDAFVRALIREAEALPWDYPGTRLPTFTEAEVEVAPGASVSRP